MYGPTELHNTIARKEVKLNLDYSSHIAHSERHTKEKYLAQIHVVFPESELIPGPLTLRLVFILLECIIDRVESGNGHF